MPLKWVMKERDEKGHFSMKMDEKLNEYRIKNKGRRERTKLGGCIL